MLDGIVDIPLLGWASGCSSNPGGDHSSHPVLHHFLVGPENRLVETVIRSVLEGTPERYHPLVLYGPSGTGKSHLARGLTGKSLLLHPGRRVVYTTAIDFARELTDAMATQAISPFTTGSLR